MLYNEQKNYNDMDCYILSEQPTACGLCGARTDFDNINGKKQLHVCLNPDCGYKFITEEDENPL